MSVRLHYFSPVNRQSLCNPCLRIANRARLIIFIYLLEFFFPLHITERDKDDQSLTAIDACLYGLNIIMPLMSVELLKYPALCFQYFNLIRIISEFHADKFFELPENLLKTVFQTIELGLNSFGQEIVPLCCYFIRDLAFHIYEQAKAGKPTLQTCKPFLKVSVSTSLCVQVQTGESYSIKKKFDFSFRY